MSECQLRKEKLTPERVEDYQFTASTGEPMRLSQLFGGKQDLIVIHNMGKGCPMCTMWADGLNGLLPHLEDRAAVVLATPDAPEVQREFAKTRGWNFRIISVKGSSFPKDMGFLPEGWQRGPQAPGISTFRRGSDRIERVGRADFGPGDSFCPTWPILDLLADGPNGWMPKFDYGRS